MIKKSRYAFPHGSITVNLEIKDDHLYINAPFLRIPAKYLIPLMRQVTELNFGTLVLAQIILEDNDIYFRYDMPLDLCEPYKLYRVIEEICIQADSNDDLFIEKFGAQRFSEMQVDPFNAEQIDTAWGKFQQYLNDAKTYQDYFLSKRWEMFGWDAYYIAFTKIDYFIRPQGVLKSELEKAVKDLNANIPFNEKIQKARSITDRLLKMERDKFAESMYMSRQFISEKPTFDVAGIQNYLSKSYNTAKDEMNKKDYIGATLTMLTGMYGLLYYYVIPQTSYNMIVEGLEKSSDKAWGDAAAALWDVYNSVMGQSQKGTNRYGVRDI